ncbi:hypothetical protein GHO41_02045 [Pseudomonas sp. FSL R10-0399]|mgnify:FL=1|uniref:I78 family peptidase inhibitor n=1 Tax=Pseudomonas TaxID=286 RepID=UPI000F4B657B|nr:I78 family peptidase inhibitor [Pseudomonas sp. FSL R10-0399]MQT56136.1 hypothetical protein [Pseudomonas sp. FSL R10-0399]
MTAFTTLKGVLLAGAVALGAVPLTAVANENGKCNTNLAINYLVPPQATPEVVEFLRTSYGAKDVRIEHPGKGYTKEYNAYRLRVLVDDQNRVGSQICG